MLSKPMFLPKRHARERRKNVVIHLAGVEARNKSRDLERYPNHRLEEIEKQPP